MRHFVDPASASSAENSFAAERPKARPPTHNFIKAIVQRASGGLGSSIDGSPDLEHTVLECRTAQHIL